MKISMNRGKQKVLTVADINLALSCNKVNCICYAHDWNIIFIEQLEPIYGLHRSSHLVDTLSSDPGAVIDLVYSNALSRAFLAGVAGLGSAGATDRPAAAKVHQGILIEDKVRLTEPLIVCLQSC